MEEFDDFDIQQSPALEEAQDILETPESAVGAGRPEGELRIEYDPLPPEEVNSRGEERQQVIQERLDAREFSKEHSQFQRDQLAQQIKSSRFYRRKEINETNQKADQLEVQNEESLRYYQGEIEREEKKLEEMEAISAEAKEARVVIEELDSQIEEIKSSFWRRLLHSSKAEQLEREKAQTKYNAPAYPPTEAEVASPQAKISGYAGDLERLQNDPRLVALRDQAFFIQDQLVKDSKDKISIFYKDNLFLRSESKEDPEARDVKKNCLELGVLLRHGVPDPSYVGVDVFTGTSRANNEVVDIQELESAQRMALAASIQPALSTHTEGMMSQGLIVSGGEITAAEQSDAGSKAVDFDTRFPKYDPNAASSNVMPNIKESFKNAVEKVGDTSNLREWNEILVKRPEFSAVYILDDGEYGTVTEVGITNMPKNTQWALEQSIELGMPAVIILESGVIMNLATDEEMTKEDLILRSVMHSPQERRELLENALGDNLEKLRDSNTKTKAEERLDIFGENFSSDEEMERYKALNRELAQARLDKYKADIQEHNRRMGEKYNARQSG
jgi:hypothetical protein